MEKGDGGSFASCLFPMRLLHLLDRDGGCGERGGFGAWVVAVDERLECCEGDIVEGARFVLGVLGTEESTEVCRIGDGGVSLIGNCKRECNGGVCGAR